MSAQRRNTDRNDWYQPPAAIGINVHLAGPPRLYQESGTPSCAKPRRPTTYFDCFLSFNKY